MDYDFTVHENGKNPVRVPEHPSIKHNDLDGKNETGTAEPNMNATKELERAGLIHRPIFKGLCPC